MKQHVEPRQSSFEFCVVFTFLELVVISHGAFQRETEASCPQLSKHECLLAG
jgi:hypothetical protein